MATLEVFNGNDQGYNAIAKIDRNTIAINQELGGIDTTVKIDKTQIKNDLLQTVTGNVLDSTQGKVLNDKISILNEGKATRVNLKGQVQLGDLRKTVIALCVVGNTNINLSSYSIGTLAIKRFNGLYGAISADITIEKRYNTTKVNYTGLVAGFKPESIKPCTFIYNGIKYGGIELNPTTGAYADVEFFGTTNFDIFGLDYANSNNATILNSEIANSISFDNVTLINGCELNAKQLATTDKIDILFPFNSGYIQSNESVYSCKLVINQSLRTCRLHFSVKKEDATVFSTQTIPFEIGTIPSSYKPIYVNANCTLSVVTSIASDGVARLIVRNTGNCSLYCNVANAKEFYGTVEWDY